MKKFAFVFLFLFLGINFVKAKQPVVDFQVTKQLIDTVNWKILEESPIRFMIEEIPSLYESDIKCIRITIGDEVCVEAHVYLDEEDQERPYLGIFSKNNKYKNKDVFMSFIDFFRKNSIAYYSLSRFEKEQPDWRLQFTASQMRETLDFLHDLNDYNQAVSKASGITFESDTLNLCLLLDKILLKYNPNDKFKKVYNQAKKDGFVFTSNAYDDFFSILVSEQTNKLNIKYSGTNLSYCGVKKDGSNIDYYCYGFAFQNLKYDFIPQLFMERLLKDLESLDYKLYSHVNKYEGASYRLTNFFEHYFFTKRNDILIILLEQDDKMYNYINVFLYIYPQCTDKKRRENIFNKRY